jgi:hypothetical protein
MQKASRMREENPRVLPGADYLVLGMVMSDRLPARVCP